MQSALVVLSGGQDSTTCLFYAKHKYERVHALSFDYQQRHAIELMSASAVADMAGVASFEILRLPEGVLASTSPLVDHQAEVGHYEDAASLPGGVEPTFVPCRNALFMVLAANRAVDLDCDRIILGVSQEDFGGYPDCRADFIESMEDSLRLALGTQAFYVEVPLICLSKMETVQLAETLPGCMDALAFSHTCYDGHYPPNPKNHASLLRARGFHEAGVDDPLIVRAITEGLLTKDYPRDGYFG